MQPLEPKLKGKIDITISGYTNSGKSILAKMIYGLIDSAGIEVNLVDDDPVGEILDEMAITKKIAATAEKTHVVVRTNRLQRNSL